MKYEELLGVEVKATGLTLMSSHPYIGASSDGLVGSTIIEIKCPYSGKDKTIDELVAGGYTHIVKKNGEWNLRKDSHYYCQIQGELAIKRYSLCHFIVWTMKDIAIIPVHFDVHFWNMELFPKLVLYFQTVVKPLLLSNHSS